MKDNFFLDTNVFVYSFDQEDLEKQSIARNLIKLSLSSQKGVISYQVIQEFCNVALQKFKQPLSVADCGKYLANILSPLAIFFPSLNFYQSALEVKQTYKYCWYDSLIVSAALLSKCSILYSEDLQHEQVIQNLQIIDPFR